MDDNVFLARRSDEVYPKHLSLDDRIAFEIADAAEWKAISPDGVFQDTKIRTLPTCSPTHPLHRQRVS